MFARSSGADWAARPDTNLVRVERLELPRLTAPEPKSGVSTNFTIPAFRAAKPRSREATLNAVALYHPIGSDQRKNHPERKGF